MLRLAFLALQCARFHFPAFLFSPFKHHELTMMAELHLKILWNGRLCEILESPGQTSPWFCDMCHIVDDTGVFNGIAMGFTSFGTSIGQLHGCKLECRDECKIRVGMAGELTVPFAYLRDSRCVFFIAIFTYFLLCA